MLVERVCGIRWRGRPLPHAGGDDPRVDLDALRVRAVDEGLQRVERRGAHPRDRGTGKAGAIAEAIAAADDLRDDRVHVRGLHVADELIDLRLGVETVPERVHPERAQLAGGRCGDGSVVGSESGRVRRKRASEHQEHDREGTREADAHPFHQNR